MSRDIKFRVFSERFKENQMLPVIKMTVGEDGTWFHAARENVGPRAFHISSDKVMQFTGLHDKNGVEIYESDIVRLFNEPTAVGAIRFFYGAWQIQNGGKAGGQLGSFDEDAIEVIGNIHQSPELLEQK